MPYSSRGDDSTRKSLKRRSVLPSKLQGQGQGRYSLGLFGHCTTERAKLELTYNCVSVFVCVLYYRQQAELEELKTQLENNSSLANRTLREEVEKSREEQERRHQVRT